jgi:L-lysine 2,3-aminomutase
MRHVLPALHAPPFGWSEDGARTRAQIDACIDYIRNTPAVRDVLLSGGDALLMSDERIEYILSNLRAIDHVEIIRIARARQWFFLNASLLSCVK